jgi:hypothetical protein
MLLSVFGRGVAMADDRSYQLEIERMRDDSHELLQALHAEPFPSDRGRVGRRGKREVAGSTELKPAVTAEAE